MKCQMQQHTCPLTVGDDATEVKNMVMQDTRLGLKSPLFTGLV